MRDFVAFWYRTRRLESDLYDFFLLKIERFVEFVSERVPVLAAMARCEADELRRAYGQANEAVAVEEAGA
jgi:hypothetical protein